MRIDAPDGHEVELVMVTADGEITDDPRAMRWAEATWYDEHGVTVRRDYLVARPSESPAERT
jgi:hypothetical protein